jgi:hypothetical protein
VVLLLAALAAEHWGLGRLAALARRPHVLGAALLAAAVALEYARWSDRPQVLIDGEVVTSAADPVPLDVHREHRIDVRCAWTTAVRRAGLCPDRMALR